MMGNIHQCCVAVPVRVYVREASDGWISKISYLGSHMFTLIPMEYL